MPYVFSNRWRIEGTLTTRGPMHIGNGESTRRDAEYLKDDDGPVEVAEVALDATGHAMIPGTALKGNLLAWLTGKDTARVFGTTEKGGKAEFWDAPSQDPPAGLDPGRAWLPTRRTAVASSVAIDRHTRTAAAKKLFHFEFVPPGVCFPVVITGQNLTDDDLALLLFALEGFNRDVDPVTLGAHAGGGWGRLLWTRIGLKTMDIAAAKAWVKGGATTCGWDAVADAPAPEYIARIETKVAQLQAIPICKLDVAIELAFDANFLVNDNSRTGKGGGLPDHAPTLEYSGTAGRPLLPSKSFRGALRSQAERIFRTLGAEGPNPSGKGLGKEEPLDTLHPISRIFGAPGWRAPLELSDFVLAEGTVMKEVKQEFVAIDRFTGGGADGKKFDAKSVYRPVLQGRLAVDLKRLDGRWSLALLILTLRDLVEGDIPFGFGSGKGYGICRARITGLTLPLWECIPPELIDGLRPGDVPALPGTGGVSEDLQSALFVWLDELQKKAQECAGEAGYVLS